MGFSPSAGGAGKPGKPGTTPVLQAGNAAALPHGTPPQVALREIAPNTYALDVSWPLAADGQPGLNGTSPTLRIGNVTAVAAGQPATGAVRDLGGGAYAIDLGLPAGAAGAAGVSPTLQIGNVTTLASTAQATAAVRNLGNGAYAVDLGIPVGAAGPAGAAYAGVPTLLGLKRITASPTDSGAQIASYVVLYPGSGRTYTWSLVTPSVAGALAISASGDLSTVSAGFDPVAAGTAITVTVRAQDDLGTKYDLAVVILKTGTAAAGPFALTYISSVEITASNSNFNFAGAIPAGATEVLIECVGGGASGFSGRIDNPNAIYVPGHGGAPGAVKQRRLRVADVPASVSVTIGAGGASAQTAATYSFSNDGGITSFGSLLQALGGRGGYHFTNTDFPFPWQLLPPSDVALGRQGIANGSLNPYPSRTIPSGQGAHAAPSMGPGSGGAGRGEAANASGCGGWAGVGRPDTAVPGSYFDSGGGSVREGSDAPNLFGYGTGGAGAGVYPGANFLAGGGSGRNPGGGGGGGSGWSGTSTGTNTLGGPGGRGAVRLHFYKVA